MLSSVATAAIGMAYWVIAAREYDPVTVGRNAAAISAMTFVAGIAELNLMSALVRFLPTMGRSTRRFVLLAYAASATMALLLGALFVTLIPLVEPSLGFIRSDPVLAGWFIASTMASAIFVLQDSVLTGLRVTHWVPAENAVFSVIKVVLVVVVAGALSHDGIFISWTIAMVLAVLPTNTYLFLLAIPRHRRAANPAVPPATGTAVVQYAAPDYLGSLCWVAATTLMPLLVINLAGATANAHFSLAWVIAYTLYVLGISMGSSLVVETAADPSSLVQRYRRVLGHTLKLLAPAVLVTIVAAPYLMWLFGPGYRAGARTLQLVALSAVPALLTNTAVSVARVQRRMHVVVAILVTLCAVVFGLSAALIGPLGITGVGLAWLIAETFVATCLLLRPSFWLPSSAGANRRPLLPSPFVPWERVRQFMHMS